MKQIYSLIIIIFFFVVLFFVVSQNIQSIISNNSDDYTNLSKSSFYKNREQLNPISNSSVSNSIIGNEYDNKKNLTVGNDTSSDVNNRPCKMPPCPQGQVCIQVCPDSLIS